MSASAENLVVSQICQLARPLDGPADLRPLAERLGTKRFVALGEASHGTHDYYTWRAELSRRLIEGHGFTWVGVEGDWPDCWRLNQWVRGLAEQEQSALDVLDHFERWPTWMWANHEVATFLDWLHAWNLAREPQRRVGFYGLDVYSLWDSLREVIRWLGEHAPEALDTALEAWHCFVPYREDPHRYARGTRLVPLACEAEVVALLVEVRQRAYAVGPASGTGAGAGAAEAEAAFAAAQNAEVAAGAERYYRTMVMGNRLSWNIRDRHMADTIDRLTHHLGPASKGLIWAHNTHVGDADGTDMARAGMVTVGQLLRRRHAGEGVALVGFTGHRGSVLAGYEWGAREHVMRMPPARPGSHEDVLHRALEAPAVIGFPADRHGAWMSTWLGHRAIGVVYDPDRELANYVPTAMGARYDALLWLERTDALRPLHPEPRPVEPEYETEPSGF